MAAVVPVCRAPLGVRLGLRIPAGLKATNPVACLKEPSGFVEIAAGEKFQQRARGGRKNEVQERVSEET